jgi:hypothetical protein
MMKMGTPSVAQDSGPWRGIYFIRSHNSSVNLAFQINQEYRRDRPKNLMTSAEYVSQNELSANALSCARPNQFSGALAHVVSHERKHVNLAAAEWRTLSVFEDIESIVTTSARMARSEAETELFEGHRQIKNASDFHTGTYNVYSFWRRPDGLLWRWMAERLYN